MGEHEHCRDLLGALSDYVDGTLGGILCAELEKHLAECENCRIVVDTLRKTVYLYHTVSTPEAVPADVRERLYKRLALEEGDGE
ncbi:MAG: zf-HC2 domain-containing protein [Anaerolineales bacterium]|nr:zf-HC2 domain-containing protein [Anaerolineales bacterium]